MGLDLTDQPASRREWFGQIWDHREVLGMLSRADFQVRYKRASFGVLWSVAVPLLQAFVLVFVFSKVIPVGSGSNYAVYVLSGVVAWSYFAGAVGSASTAIVDGSGLTDKVWFPRALLALVPTLANAVSFGVSLLVLFIALPIFSVAPGIKLFLLVPATGLLLLFSTGLGLMLASLHVYFRDVKYLTAAALMVWFYLTPIVYPETILSHTMLTALDLNPMTGITILFQKATVGGRTPWHFAIGVSLLATIFVFVLSIEVNRRHDRLFVDLL